MDKTNSPMITEHMFWLLVDSGRKNFDSFHDLLAQLSDSQLTGFSWMFEEFAGRFYDEQYLDLINDKMNLSEDAMEDLCGWIVGQGKDFYQQVLNNPALFPLDPSNDDPGIELQYEAGSIYFERNGEEIPPWEDFL